MGLQPLGLDHKLHHAVEGPVVKRGALPARKKIGDDALEERKVHLQKLGKVHVLCMCICHVYACVHVMCMYVCMSCVFISCT